MSNTSTFFLKVYSVSSDFWQYLQVTRQLPEPFSSGNAVMEKQVISFCPHLCTHTHMNAFAYFDIRFYDIQFIIHFLSHFYTFLQWMCSGKFFVASYKTST